VRRRRLWLLVFVLVVLGWAAAAGASLLRARTDLGAGLASVQRAQKLTAPADLVAGRPLADLHDATAAFERGHDRLSSPLVAPLKLLPVAGRQLRSATALAGASAQISDVGRDAVQEAQRALQRPPSAGAERIALLRELGGVATRAEGRLAGIRLGPSTALVGTLAEKRAELEERLAELRRTLRDGGTAATGLADLLQGPRRYLVLAANNSEMRAGSGMFLSVGEMAFADGGFSLGEFQPAGDLYRDNPPPVTDPDLAARWGWLNPNKEWRNLAASPRFDASAELATRMWGTPVDGVLALDPIAVQAIIEATGPVEVGGRRLEADAVDDFLLYEQYVGITSINPSAQAGRRELLGLLAKAALDNVDRGGWDMARLASTLARAARGRHVMAWAARPEEQRVWESAGIDGRLDDDSLMVSLLNRSANKLDRFVTLDADLSLRPDGGATAAELRVTVTNDTPPDAPVYVAGPFPGSPVGGGDYFGILSVNLPGFAGDIDSDGGDPVAAGTDGPTRVHAVPVTVARGQSKAVIFRFRMAASGSLRVEPSARVPAVSWTAPGGSWQSGEARRVSW
jgi:hypothetical protein